MRAITAATQRAPLEAARRTIVKEFHSGRTVPPDSQFAIEDHIAVLDAVRRALRQARREPMQRAERFEATDNVDLYVGLAEIMVKGFAVTPPSAPSRSPSRGRC